MLGLATCPSCQAEVVEGARFCSECGANLASGAPPSLPPSTPDTAPSPNPSSTAISPPPAPTPSPARPSYPAPYPSPRYYPAPLTRTPYAYRSAPPPRSASPTAAGILLIISGIIAMAAWGLIVFFASSSYERYFPGISGIFCVCGAIEFIFALVMIAGGLMALDRRMWGLALVGSILGLFTFGFVFETSIMSLVALILLAVSHDEFR